jgi:hypothetical protein
MPDESNSSNIIAPAPVEQRSGAVDIIQRTIAPLVALLVILAYLFLMWRMWGIRAIKGEWDNGIILFNSLEAIAFSATGFLFGREVNRKRAENAEKTAAKATNEAIDAKTDAADKTAKAKALTQAIESKVATRGMQSRGTTFRGMPGERGMPEDAPAPTQDDLQEMADLAHRLFS